MAPHVTDWRTDPDWFNALNKICNFTMDAAASHDNTLLDTYCTEQGKFTSIRTEDGVIGHIQIGGITSGLDPKAWEGERVYCNPPYVHIYPWVELAATANHEGAVLLLPANMDPKWAHKFVLPERYRPMAPVELRFGSEEEVWRGYRQGEKVVLFREGRLKFLHPTYPDKDNPRYPNLLVAYGDILAPAL